MKSYLSTLGLLLSFLGVMGQSKARLSQSSLAISTIAREEIEKSGKFQINLSVIQPIGGFADNNLGTGFGASGRIHFGQRVNYYPDHDSTTPWLEPADIENSNLISAEQILKNLINHHSWVASDTLQPYFNFQLEKRAFDFFIEPGVQFLTGKTHDFGQYTYKSDPVTIGYINAGLTYNPCFRGELSVQAGPAMLFFPNGSEFGFKGGINGSYDFSKPISQYSNLMVQGGKRPGLGLLAGVSYNKFKEIDGFFTAELGIRIVF